MAVDIGWYYDESGKYLFGDRSKAAPTQQAPRGAMLQQGMDYQAPNTLDLTQEQGPAADAGRANVSYLNATQKYSPTEEVSQEVDPVVKEKESATATGATKSADVLSKGGDAKDALSAGLIASGNPYAVGTGLALQTLSSVQKQKQANKMNKYTAEVSKLQNRQEQINKLAQIGQSLKA